MAWGEDAAERYEMQEPTELVRPDGSVRNVLPVAIQFRYVGFSFPACTKRRPCLGCLEKKR